MTWWKFYFLWKCSKNGESWITAETQSLLLKYLCDIYLLLWCLVAKHMVRTEGVALLGVHLFQWNWLPDKNRFQSDPLTKWWQGSVRLNRTETCCFGLDTLILTSVLAALIRLLLSGSWWISLWGAKTPKYIIGPIRSSKCIEAIRLQSECVSVIRLTTEPQPGPSSHHLHRRYSALMVCWKCTKILICFFR